MTKQPLALYSRDIQRAHWAEVAPTVGCKPLVLREFFTLLDWLDHGFVGERDDGQRVLVGDSYFEDGPCITAAQAAEQFGRGHGLRLQILPGGWAPGETTMLVFTVVDAPAALDLLDELRVPQPSRFLPRGVTLHQARRERHRRQVAADKALWLMLDAEKEKERARQAAEALAECSAAGCDFDQPI